MPGVVVATPFMDESLPLCHPRTAEHFYEPSAEAREAGYGVETQGSSQPAPAGKGASRLRPIAPQLVTMEQAVRLIPDPHWWLQELFAGQHLLIRKTDVGIEGIDGEGTVVPLPPAVVEAAARIRFRWVMEGVLDGAEFEAFDLAQFAMLDFRTLDYSTRWAGLRQLGFPVSRHLRIAETAVDVGVKAELLQRLRAGGKPGFVLKKSNGTCRPGCSGCEDNLLQCHFERSVRSSPSAETSSKAE